MDIASEAIELHNRTRPIERWTWLCTFVIPFRNFDANDNCNCVDISEISNLRVFSI